MYPDTDSPPIPLLDQDIERLGRDLPVESAEALQIMKNWGIPADTYTYLLRKNLFSLIREMVEKQGEDPVFAGTLFGHRLKFVEGHYEKAKDFDYARVAGMLAALRQEGLDAGLIRTMLPVIYQHPKMDLASVLTSIGFVRMDEAQILSNLSFFSKKFDSIRRSQSEHNRVNWLMGQLRENALGNIPLKRLREVIRAS